MDVVTKKTLFKSFSLSGIRCHNKIEATESIENINEQV